MCISERNLSIEAPTAGVIISVIHSKPTNRSIQTIFIVISFALEYGDNNYNIDSSNFDKKNWSLKLITMYNWMFTLHFDYYYCVLSHPADRKIHMCDTFSLLYSDECTNKAWHCRLIAFNHSQSHTHTAEERIWDRWNREWNISTNDNCKLEALQNIVSSFAYGMKKVNVIDLFKYIECVCCVEHPASTQTQPLYSQPRFIVAIWQ